MAQMFFLALCWPIMFWPSLARRLRLEDMVSNLSSAPSYSETSWNCVNWPGSGPCLECTAHLQGIMSEIYGTCQKCPRGWVLLPGPPAPSVSGDVGHRSVNGTKVYWHNHCAELVGEERRLIMLRHGESKWNSVMERTHKAAGLVGAWLGSDSPLSRCGLLQAQRLASVLSKAHRAVYKEDARPTDEISQTDAFVRLAGARSDLYTVDLEEALTITDSVSDRVVTDDDMVERLAKQENRDELDVLLGRRCDSTNFVSSQLVRAMDTLLIATLESRLQCQSPWCISSNLQEIEHNSDCSPKSRPHEHPVMATEQRKSYIANRMANTEEYIEARYEGADVSRYVKNFGQSERARWYNQSEQMFSELDSIFASEKVFTVWGGHSIWFRHFFKKFADLSDPVCKQLGVVKMANTAMVSIRLRRVDSPARYAAFDCKFLYLGTSEQYEMKHHEEEEDGAVAVPEPSDFDRGVQSILGWKCCCSRTDYKDARVYFTTRKSLERCVLVKTKHCSQPKTWEELWPVDEALLESYAGYHWGHNRGPCIVQTATSD